MEALGGVASVIAVVELSANVAKLCVQYARAVQNAQGEIKRLQTSVNSLQDVLKEAQQIIDEPAGTRLAISSKTSALLDGCSMHLSNLQEKLNPRKSRKLMSRIGLQDLKWPFGRKELDGIIDELARDKQTVALAFQLDQM